MENATSCLLWKEHPTICIILLLLCFSWKGGRSIMVWVYMSKEELKRERREVDILANISWAGVDGHRLYKRFRLLLASLFNLASTWVQGSYKFCPEAGVLDELYSDKPSQRSSHTGPPDYIRWTRFQPILTGVPVRQLRWAGLADYMVRLKLSPLESELLLNSQKLCTSVLCTTV
jgi:hypothetical protein